mmetsp:Transcript_9095/g.24521  ORF Transcript_9095/g.24521 Transcript_9095/m.24521 type:complete len:286 (-) Transcript_9095:826-1683(-)|eukprot:384642-Pelagomonas_calceolata.AAC.1
MKENAWFQLWAIVTNFAFQNIQDALAGNVPEASGALSVVAMTFRRQRVQPLVYHYCSMQVVSDVLLVWNNVEHRPPAPSSCQNYSVVWESTNTLNNRYKHSDMLHNEIALLVDDDLLLDSRTLVYALAAVQADKKTVVGFFPRYVKWKGTEWRYTFSKWKENPRLFQLTTGQAHVLHTEWMRSFTKLPAPLLQFIDQNKPTCEDITLHFLIASTPKSRLMCIRPCQARALGSGGMSTGEVSHWPKKRSACVNRLVSYYNHNPLRNNTLSFSCPEAKRRFGVFANL